MEILTRKQKVLIEHSEILKEFKILQQLFSRYDQITESTLLELTDEEKQFVNNMLPSIIKSGEKEWKTDGQIAEDRGPDKSNYVHCSLCNQPNRYVFYIYNQLNGKPLNVGSDCIKQFGILDREGLKYTDLIKDAQKIRKISILEQEYPGIQRTIRNWDNELDQYDLSIPSFLEDPYRGLGIEIRRAFNSFINDKSAMEDIKPLFDNALQERQRLIDEMKKWVRENEGKEFAATKEIEIWMKRNNESTGLEWLKEDGRVDHRTAHRIYEPQFMEEMAQRFRITYEEIGVSLWEPAPDLKGYYITIPPQRDIKLLCPHDILIKRYSGGYFGTEAEWATLEQLLDLSVIRGQRRDYELLFDRIIRLVPGVSLYNSDVDRDFAIFREDKHFIKISLKEITKRYKNIAYGKTDMINEAKKTILDKNNLRYTWDEIQEFGYGLR